jgi:putative peptidoglycan lipid II flippase
VQAPVNTHQDEKRAVAASALVMAGGTMVSRVLGYGREMAMYAIFDRTVTDAYLAAYRLPNMFRRLLGEGSLSVSFIPVFIDLLKHGHTKRDEIPLEARKLVNGMFTLLICVLTILTILGVLFSEQIVAVLVAGEGFMSIPGKYELTVKMAKIMFGFIFLISLYAYFMAILNSVKKFALAAFAPTLFNIIMVVSTFIPDDQAPFKGFYLSLGVMIGGFLQMAILIPALVREGFLPRLTTEVMSPHIKRIFKTMIPSWVGLGILQLTFLVNTRFASELSEGNISWLYLTDRILELPLSLFAVSLSSALLPTLSRLWSQGARKEMSETSAHYLKMVFFLAVPSAVGVYMMAEPIVQILFEHGRFHAEETRMTAAILRVNSVGILTYAGIRVIVAPFYAIKNTWLPATCAAFSLLIHIVLASQLIKTHGAVGLVASSMISSFVNLSLLTLFHNRLIGRLPLGKFFYSGLKFAASAAVMGVILKAYYFAAPFVGDVKIMRAIVFAAFAGTGALLYFATAHALRVEEARETWGGISRRIKGRLKRS